MLELVVANSWTDCLNRESIIVKPYKPLLGLKEHKPWEIQEIQNLKH